MDRSGIYIIIATLSVLAFGSMPISATECTDGIINACVFEIDPTCRFYRKELKCLEAIDQSTCDDRMRETLSDVIANTRSYAETCPGLPDGTCWFSAIKPCRDDVPLKVYYAKSVTEDGKKEACKLFKGKEDDSIDCFKSLKSKCKPDFLLKYFDMHIEKIEAIKKICAEY